MDRRHAIICVLDWVLRLAIGGVFVYAGFVKALDPARFVGDVDAYRILPYSGAVMVGLYLPWLEMVCGVGLMVGWMRNGATALLSALAMIFIAAVVSAWMRGLDISCGCFGAQSQSTEEVWMVIRNGLILIGLFAIAFFSFSVRWSHRSQQNISGPQITG